MLPGFLNDMRVCCALDCMLQYTLDSNIARLRETRTSTRYVVEVDPVVVLAHPGPKLFGVVN